jgi:hypothetical protein
VRIASPPAAALPDSLFEQLAMVLKFANILTGETSVFPAQA